MMIITHEGEIISKKDEFNSRHSWIKTNTHSWECQKCDCKKIQIDKQEYSYIMNNNNTGKAPVCDNSKLQIIKKQKNEKRNPYTEAKQIKLNFD